MMRLRKTLGAEKEIPAAFIGFLLRGLVFRGIPGDDGLRVQDASTKKGGCSASQVVSLMSSYFEEDIMIGLKRLK